MSLAAQRETAGDRRCRIKSLIGSVLTNPKLVRRHSRWTGDDGALIIHRPIKRNGAVGTLHLVSGERTRIGRKHRIGTGIVFGRDVKLDGFVEDRGAVPVKSK